MGGSGLKEALCTIYAPGSVDMMMVGKEIARGFRGLTLTEAALNKIIVKKALTEAGTVANTFSFLTI